MPLYLRAGVFGTGAGFAAFHTARLIGVTYGWALVADWLVAAVVTLIVLGRSRAL